MAEENAFNLEDLVVPGDAVGVDKDEAEDREEKGHSPRRAFHYDYDLASA